MQPDPVRAKLEHIPLDCLLGGEQHKADFRPVMAAFIKHFPLLESEVVHAAASRLDDILRRIRY
jgi:hypothetical protein